MDIMNGLRTGMYMYISSIHNWLCNTCSYVHTLTDDTVTSKAASSHEHRRYAST